MNDKMVARELIGVAGMLAKVGDVIIIPAPGLDVVMDSVSLDDSDVVAFIERVLRSHGFGSKQKGIGTYGSDYWVKGGKKYRVHGDTEDEKILLEEILTLDWDRPGPW